MSRLRRGFWRGLVFALALLVGLGIPHVWQLNRQVTTQFEGRRWELPARVYARPLELYAGRELTVRELRSELDLLHYQRVAGSPRLPGQYRVRGQRVRLITRPFQFPDEAQPSQRLELRFADGRLAAVDDPEGHRPLGLFRLEPVKIADIYPRHNEDRLLVRLDQVPRLLIDTLLTVEDRDFYRHHGVQPKAILRALIANLRAGHTVQGGSTLTQQLVKNYFLTNERSLARKLNEAIMALLLEWHYDKDEILQAYLNEIYLGQDGARAIHGFGLAARFYFQRDLADLEPEQIALLVGLAKGASWYDPRRHPRRALRRRNVVLDALAHEGVLDAATVARLKQRPLGVTRRVPSGVTPFPAFLQLVRQQLLRDYREEDLRSEGLRIFTTLDPLVQLATERAATRELARIEKERRLAAGSLQVAMLVASPEQGEVLAALGGRDPRYAGFNHVLAMRRPVGSLLKPAVYLTALARPDYHLLTPLDDRELVLEQRDGEWRPHNYDRQEHGDVPLLLALAHSYNIATVRLGLAVGLPAVIDTLQRLGIPGPLKPYPSLLLGAIDLSPLDVLQMYQTLAAGGFRAPLRAIVAVIDTQGQTLQRYPLEVQQTLPADATFLLTTALHQVTVRGTARALQYLLPPELKVAGKTGTTNDLRDSWFAGFSGGHVAVAWVGRDDNQPTGLTGSSGALRLWARLFATLPTRPLQPLQPDDIEWARADIERGVLLAEDCPGGDWLPFRQDAARPPLVGCDDGAGAPPARAASAADSGGALRHGLQRLRRLFQSAH